MVFLVVDLKSGGLDGWYFEREYAEASCEAWAETLGHNMVVVVECKEDRKRRLLISPAALLNERMFRQCTV